jgi:hypothetical protein
VVGRTMRMGAAAACIASVRDESRVVLRARRDDHLTRPVSLLGYSSGGESLRRHILRLRARRSAHLQQQAGSCAGQLTCVPCSHSPSTPRRSWRP